MPFVLGDTVPGAWIDYLLDTDYPLPVSPVQPPDEPARRIGRIIAGLFVKNRSTIQYGIGQVPEAVTDAILDKASRIWASTPSCLPMPCAVWWMKGW
jgi:4-hydroxybutyrate CoA-transferase